MELVFDGCTINPRTYNLAIVMIVEALKSTAAYAKGGIYLDVRKITRARHNRQQLIIDNLPTTLRNGLLEILTCLCTKVPNCRRYNHGRLIYYFPLEDVLINSLVTSDVVVAINTLNALYNDCKKNMMKKRKRAK